MVILIWLGASFHKLNRGSYRQRDSKLGSLMTMVVTSTPLSSLHTIPRHFYSATCKLSSPSLHILLRQIHQKSPSKPPHYSHGNGVLSIRSYREESNSISGFANRVIGALPVIGLLVRIFSDEGGVGSDLVDFAEFRRRVGKNSSMNDSLAFFEFRDRRGRVIGISSPFQSIKP